VFLLTGELRAVRSFPLVTPRSEGQLQIRWMVEDGADAAAGEAVEEWAMFPRVRDVIRHSRQPFQRMHGFAIPSQSRIVLERLVDDCLLAVEVDESLK